MSALQILLALLAILYLAGAVATFIYTRKGFGRARASIIAILWPLMGLCLVGYALLIAGLE